MQQLPKLEVGQYFKYLDRLIGKIEKKIHCKASNETLYVYTIVYRRIDNFKGSFYHGRLFHQIISPLGFDFKTIQALYMDANRDSLE